MDGFQGLPPLAEVQEAKPPGGFQGEALILFPPISRLQKGGGGRI